MHYCTAWYHIHIVTLKLLCNYFRLKSLYSVLYLIFTLVVMAHESNTFPWLDHLTCSYQLAAQNMVLFCAVPKEFGYEV